MLILRKIILVDLKCYIENFWVEEVYIMLEKFQP